MSARQRQLRLGDYLNHMEEAAALASEYVRDISSAGSMTRKPSKGLESWQCNFPLCLLTGA